MGLLFFMKIMQMECVEYGCVCVGKLPMHV